MSADRETIYERFGFVVEDDVTGLVGMAKKESADDDESLLTAVCMVEELESSAHSLRHRLEDARARIAKPVGWSQIHRLHISRGDAEVCVKSDPCCHRIGYVRAISDDGFVLMSVSITDGVWRHKIEWSDVAGAWERGTKPDPCPACPGVLEEKAAETLDAATGEGRR